ncbi:hypothetical protein SELR_00870 [Selenomonas ruminantium subsp. lactilytica TAM6421]|uniref:Peptidase propeptide and YPEB domain-containing protein n=1 Tax=Selenomonas ruminantium subsp. lactilytica (strain NBRC 103574 / TAM6421) TaxID=927704 RepID=I0GM08_SELRL|nr:hypothetical protein [Selenomonas ruminantium]BAL81795.1 hypothetical protein SELR_00870 [Selenomonas ruminantium subsp. lactilytica TAM6421]
MKKYVGMMLGLLVWGGLLYVQGTPAITAEIAEEAVVAAHPDTAFCEVEHHGTDFEVAYVTTGLQQGHVTLDKDGHIVSAQ